MEREGKGLFLGDTWIGVLLFADDVTLLSQHAEDLRSMLKDLQTVLLEAGLQCNEKILVFLRASRTPNAARSAHAPRNQQNA